MHDDFDPTPTGLLRCLQVLAAEAAYLGLRGTFAALQDAVATCQDEGQVLLPTPFDGLSTGPLH